MRKDLEQRALKAFYKRMNETAKSLNLGKTTNFSVAHGMHHDYNYSCALEVATISWNAMRSHPVFREIVDTKEFELPSRVR